MKYSQHAPCDREDLEDLLVLVPPWVRMVCPREEASHIDCRLMTKITEELEDFGREKLLELQGNILMPHPIDLLVSQVP